MSMEDIIGHSEKDIKDIVKDFVKEWKKRWNISNQDVKKITRMRFVGSFAKGNYDESSDLDVLVGYEGEMHYDEFMRINELDNKIYSPELDREIKIDIIPVKDENFERELNFYLEKE